MRERDIVELNQLAYRYARAVDACDVAGLQAVFTPKARLKAYHPDEDTPFTDITGHAQLASIPDSMRGMYRKTAHMMTNHVVEVAEDGESATGEVLCTARHLTNDGAQSVNVIIRYVDRYARQNGKWLIADRQIRFLWSEIHEVGDSGMGRGEKGSAD